MNLGDGILCAGRRICRRDPSLAVAGGIDGGGRSRDGRNCRRSSRAAVRSESGWIGPQSHEVAEHPVGNPVARLDALNFIKFPMDAEINPALAVFFGGWAEAVKGARH